MGEKNKAFFDIPASTAMQCNGELALKIHTGSCDMGTYLSYEEFVSYGTGVSIPEEEYGQISQAADIMINGLMSIGENMDDPPEDILKAVAYQTAYIHENGGVMAIGEADIATERIGNYQWSAARQLGDRPSSRNSLHPLVLTLLLRTGKLHRGGRHAQ